MAKRGLLMRAERETAKRMQALGRAALSQVESIARAALGAARQARRSRGSKAALRAIAVAQHRAEDIAGQLGQLSLTLRGGGRKRVKRRKATRSKAVRKALRKTTKRASRKKRG
jgi:hypothetical protein